MRPDHTAVNRWQSAPNDVKCRDSEAILKGHAVIGTKTSGRCRAWGLGAITAAVMAMAAVTVLTAAPARADEEILRKESIYNTIIVSEGNGYRYLKFGHKNIHYYETTYNPNDDLELPSAYTQFLTAGVAYADNLDKAVMIGMGGGRTSTYLARSIPSLDVTGVELDPAIVDIAREYFGFKEGPNLKVVERDGRIFMRQTDETYDMIFVDAYRGHYVPFHLLTQEFYELLESKMAPGGVVVQNIAPTTMLYDYAISTIGTVFDSVDIYPARGNYVAIAYNGPRKPDAWLAARAAERQQALDLRYDLSYLVAERAAIRTRIDAEKVLTDDYAPANYLKSVERYRNSLKRNR